MKFKYSKITVDEKLNNIIKSNPKFEYLLDDDTEKKYDIFILKKSRKINLLQKLILISKDPIILNYLIQNINLYIDHINIKNEIGCSSLIIACGNINENSIVLIKLLLENGADPNIQDNGGHTAMHHICSNLDPISKEIIKILLNYKANINLQNTRGDTALILSCELKNLIIDKEFIKVLLENGADPNLQNKNGLTALMIFCKNLDEYYSMQTFGIIYSIANFNSNYSIKNFDNDFSIENVKILLEYNANLSVKNNNGMSILDIMKKIPLRYSNNVIIKLLSDYNTDSV